MPHGKIAILFLCQNNFKGISGFGVLSQGATLLLPDKDHLMVYSCQGRMPRQLVDKPYKVNVAFNSVVLFSVLCYATTTYFTFMKKLRTRKATVEPLGVSAKRNPRDAIFRLSFCTL